MTYMSSAPGSVGMVRVVSQEGHSGMKINRSQPDCTVSRAKGSDHRALPCGPAIPGAMAPQMSFLKD